MKKVKILAVSSGGGHLTELISAIPNKYVHETVFVTSKNGHTVVSLSELNHRFIVDPHNSGFKYILNLFQSIVIVFLINPKIVISTGAGIAVPILLICRALRKRIIFIETGARISTPSKTGLLAHNISNHFFFQSEQLREFYRKGRLVRL